MRNGPAFGCVFPGRIEQNPPGARAEQLRWECKPVKRGSSWGERGHLPWLPLIWLAGALGPHALPEAWSLTDPGARIVDAVMAMALGLAAVGAVCFAFRGKNPVSTSSGSGRGGRALMWAATGLWILVAWPRGSDVRYGPNAMTSLALVFAVVAILAYAWFHVRVVLPKARGARTSSVLLVAALLTVAAASVATLWEPNGIAFLLWLLAVGLALALAPVMAIEWLSRRAPGGGATPPTA